MIEGKEEEGGGKAGKTRFALSVTSLYTLATSVATHIYAL